MNDFDVIQDKEKFLISELKKYDPRTASPELRQALENAYSREYAQQESDSNSLRDLEGCF